MVNFDVCIIGGGASGCMAAILLAKKSFNVCVIDKFEKPAKKLLVTGNGRCNITNKNMNSNFYNQNIARYLNVFNEKNAIDFFKSIGVDIYADAEDRCYPISNSAKTVQHCFINQFEKLGITFFGENIACDVEQKDDCFLVITDKEKLQCKNVIFACGLNDFALSIFKKYNIKYNKIVPSLVALKTKQSTKKLDGIRVSNVEVIANLNGEKIIESGEVLFKEHGLSGIVIFNISSIFARNKCFEGKISINLLKNYTNLQISNFINEKLDIFKNVQSLLESMFTKELAKEILNRANIDFDFNSSLLSEAQIQSIVNVITNFDFDIVEHYENNQVLSGGVELNDLTDCLESRTKNGIYFCGEICDIDGICGGYNLQWAWTSAYIVASEIISSFKQ